MEHSGSLKVGHLLTSVWAGGLEGFVLSLSTSLSDQGIQSRVYSWTGDDKWEAPFREKGIDVVAIGGPMRIRSLLDPFRFALAWVRLVRRLHADRIDILHTHDFFPAMVGRTASIVARVPHRVTTFHNLYDWWPKWVFQVNKFLARRTDAITCVSESVRDFMIKAEGLPSSRYKTILNGVDEKRFTIDPQARTSIRRQLEIQDHEILIGSVGSITTRKAQWILVKAAAPLIRDGYPLQVRIWGANSDNPQHAEKELLALVAELGIADRFRILPPRNDIASIYNAMDIHCMTSVAEGLSLASIEAMMAGVFPIYSDIGPFREVVQDGASGRLFHTSDPADLEDVLRQTIPTLRNQPGRDTQIRQRAIERFGLARMASEYLVLYKHLVAGKARS